MKEIFDEKYLGLLSVALLSVILSLLLLLLVMLYLQL